MGIFSTDKRVYRQDFNNTLKEIPDISQKERQYLNQVFGNDLIDGLTEFELKQKIEKLRHNTNDILDPWELEQAKRKILQRFGK